MSKQNGRHPVTVVAEVQSMEMNLDHSGAYRLLLADGSRILAAVEPWQWGHLEGMHHEGRYPLKIVGTGDFCDSQLQRIVSVDIRLTDRVIPPEYADARSLWERIGPISKSVDWSGVPADAATNMHHYLYGRRKVDE